MIAKFIYEGVADRYAAKEFGMRDSYDDFGFKAHIFNLKKDGNIITYIDDKPLVKNPKALRDFPPDCRGVLTNDGDLYVIADSFNIIHVDILSKMKQKGIISESPTSWEDLTKRVPDEFICVQRVWNKDVFALSDSYVLPKKDGRDEALQLFKSYTKSGNKRHPQFKFINENTIRTARRILTPEERLDRKKYNVGFFVNESVEDILKPKSEEEINNALDEFDADELYDKWRYSDNIQYLLCSIDKGLEQIDDDFLVDLLDLEEDKNIDKMFPYVIKQFPYDIKQINKNTYEIQFGDLNQLTDLFYSPDILDVNLQKIIDGDSFELFYVSHSDIDLDNYDYEIKILSKKNINIKRLIDFVKRELDIDEKTLIEIFDEIKRFPESISYKVFKHTLSECQTIANESEAYECIMNSIKENIGNPEYKENKYHIQLPKERVIKTFMATSQDFKFEIKEPYNGFNGDISDYPEVFNDVLDEKISENDPIIKESFQNNRRKRLNETSNDVLKPKSEEEILNDMILNKMPLKDILFKSVLRGYLNGVKYAIENGVFVDIKQESFPHKTALIYAATKGYKNIVEYLIENDADVNMVDDYNHSVLLYARCNNGKNVIRILKKHGAV